MAARSLVLVLLLPVAASCSRGGDTPDSGLADSGPFSVSGSVQIFPLAATWMSAHGAAATPLDALEVRIQDPFVLLREADAGLSPSSVLVAADGVFTFTDVDGWIVSGVSASVLDSRPAADRDAGGVPARVVIASETILFEGPPQTVAATVAWALPTQFVTALSVASGRDLEEHGFLVGQVLDAQGAPVAGVSVSGHDLDPARLSYLGADLAPIPGASSTGPSGAFLVAGPLDMMDFSVADRPELGAHKALARPAQGFTLILRPP